MKRWKAVVAWSVVLAVGGSAAAAGAKNPVQAQISELRGLIRKLRDNERATQRAIDQLYNGVIARDGKPEVLRERLREALRQQEKWTLERLDERYRVILAATGTGETNLAVMRRFLREIEKEMLADVHDSAEADRIKADFKERIRTLKSDSHALARERAWLRTRRDEQKEQVRAAYEARIGELGTDVRLVEAEIRRMARERDALHRLVRAETQTRIKLLEQEIKQLEQVAKVPRARGAAPKPPAGHRR